MTRFALLCCLASTVTGCFVVFDDDDPGVCALAEDREPTSAPAPLRNPDSLTCDSIGGGCDPSCGPCPEATNTARLARPTPPLPSWNYCGHRCETLGESACAADPECRVVKDARCATSYDCETDFLGCFPTDQQTDHALDCNTAQDGWTCSRSNGCTALHYAVGGQPYSEPAIERRAFAMCLYEGQAPGSCWDPVACDAAPPPCPDGTTPGVAELCYTGACIPLDLCEPRPNQ